MRDRNRAGAVVVWLCAAACACACARARRTPDDTLVVIVDQQEASDLDPRYTQNALEIKLSRIVAPGLTTVDQPSLEPTLLLAERIDRIDDLTWEVTVRPDVRFSDGSPLTAADVVYTFASTIDPAMKSRYRLDFDNRLVSVEQLDDRRVRFRLEQPLATFMTDLDYGIVSRAAATAGTTPGRFDKGGVVGAGPYKLVRFRPGEVTLERNPYWFGAAPPLERIVVRSIRDANARLLMLVGGSADFTQNSVRLDLLAQVADRPRIHVESGPSAILTYLMFNNVDPILSDRRVRQAIAMAVDRDKIVRGKFGGRAVLATGLLPPSHWAYSDDVTRWPFDPERAGRLLDEAGYPDPDGPGGRPRFALTYKTSSDAFRVGVARVIATQLADVGIEVEVRPFEFATFFADVKAGNYQLASMQTAEIVEPDMYWTYFHSERIPSKEFPDQHNRWRYRSPEADRLIEAGRHELDPVRRREIYRQIQRLMSDDMPILPLWHEDNVAVMNKDVEGYVVLPNARLSPLAGCSKRVH